MLRNVVAIGVRLNKPPSEILGMSVEDYELLLAHFLLEGQDAERISAKQRARSNLAKIRR